MCQGSSWDSSIAQWVEHRTRDWWTFSQSFRGHDSSVDTFSQYAREWVKNAMYIRIYHRSVTIDIEFYISDLVYVPKVFRIKPYHWGSFISWSSCNGIQFSGVSILRTYYPDSSNWQRLGFPHRIARGWVHTESTMVSVIHPQAFPCMIYNIISCATVTYNRKAGTHDRGMALNIKSIQFPLITKH